MTWALPSYRGRCQTGWAIRKDRRTGRWEAYNRAYYDGPPVPFATMRRAAAYVEASTYGAHDRAITHNYDRPVFYPIVTADREAQHRPAEGRWDASWILMPQRYVVGFDGSHEGEFTVCLGEFDPDEKGVRWSLTPKGLCGAMGLPIEVLR